MYDSEDHTDKQPDALGPELQVISLDDNVG